MKNFLKIIFGSLIGFLLGLFLIFWILIGVASGIGKKSAPKVEANSILEIRLNPTLPDKSNEDPFSNFNPVSFELSPTTGLFRLGKILEAAKKDDKIKGIYLRSDMIAESFATLMTLHEMLDDFRESGKFIVSFNDFSTQRSYLVSSAADEVYLHPMGIFEFDGLSIETIYFKKLMEKLDIEPMTFYAGKFKSASEPFRREDMSEENREQLRVILEGIYSDYLQVIEERRGVGREELERIADGLLVADPQDAVNFKLVDALMYEDEVMDVLREKLGFTDDDKLHLISMDDYAESVTFHGDLKVDEKVAVVYAEGDIILGEGDFSNIGGERYMKLIRDLRKDDDIKAIVLRVNSGGGSAFASEQIWRELKETQKDKPVVVSMGNYAASGGYYISCMADSIFAESSTITGSIGVVGILLNLEEFFGNKIGVTFDREKTGPYSDFGNINRDWQERETEVVEMQIKKIYDDFKAKVAEGREMSAEEVEEIAQGRIWTGEQAVEIGLVDDIGGLDRAVAAAAKLAKIESYRVKEYPEPEKFIDKFMEDFMSARVDRKLEKELGEFYEQYQMLQKVRHMEGIQARLPYELEVR